jgi:hypothetical protein
MGPGNRVWGRVLGALGRPWPPYFGEIRVGIGLVPSLAWVGLTLFSIRAAVKRSATERFLVTMILATTLLFALGLRYGDEASPWRWCTRSFPAPPASEPSLATCCS